MNCCYRKYMQSPYRLSGFYLCAINIILKIFEVYGIFILTNGAEKYKIYEA